MTLRDSLDLIRVVRPEAGQAGAPPVWLRRRR